MSVLTRLERWVAAQPDSLLFSFLDHTGAEVERHTYASFLARVNMIASHLAARGYEPGARAVLAFPPGLDMIAALFACARADLIAVPGPPPTAHGLTTALLRIAHAARDCRAAVIVSTREGMTLLTGETAVGAAPDETGFLAGLDWVFADEIADPAGPVPRRPHGDVFFLQYTSGSTSRPKGVMVTHDNILANCGLVVDHEKPVAVTWLPQHHDMGLIGYYIFIALSGGTTHGFSTTTFIQRPALWLETISDRRATASSAPNFAFNYCLRPGRVSDETIDRLDLSSLVFLMAAAEPIRPDTYRRFFNRFARTGLKPESFFVAYGLAEHTLAVTNYGRRALSVNNRELAFGHARLTKESSEIGQAQHLMSCGVSLGDNKVKIVDLDQCAPLPDSRVGEIWVTGASKCKGYWENPEQTAETFQARLAGEPPGAPTWMRTGDMGFMHDGELYVSGRLKDMIILRGQNFYPQDIETIVETACPAVRAGCVAAFAIDEDRAPLVAVVAEVNGRRAEADGDTVRGAVRERLGLDLGVVAFVPPKSIPKTSSGKLMRFEARRMLVDGEFAVIAQTARAREEDEEAFDEVGITPFEALRRRYRLTGDEPIMLMEAGVDFDLVVVMHEIKELLGRHGARRIGEQVDVRVVQQMTVTDLFRIMEEFARAPEAAVVEMRQLVSDVRAAQAEAEREQMQKDRALAFAPGRVPGPLSGEPAETILLTGGTGFLGPFLLTSLLAQTEARIKVLVRTADPEQAMGRLRTQLRLAGVLGPATAAALEERVETVYGDLEKPCLDLAPDAWRALADGVDAIYHNAATVNYLFTYARMRDANVAGTNELLRLAFDGRPKAFNHVSTTFVFGWAMKDFLYETDNNDEMDLLDFGYSQSKWVSEQLVLDARRRGLATRIFRPALITPSVAGGGANFDITIRLLAFMIKHGIGVDALNQVSFTPADVTANNIIAISQSPRTLNGVFHVVRDDYACMKQVTDIISAQTGRQFDLFSLPDFVPEVIRRCARDDLLFPLLDFLIGSIDAISTMEFKRYDNTAYQAARDASAAGQRDPSMEDTVGGILDFIARHRIG